MFGRLRLVPDARFTEVPEIAALGPDPFEQGIDVDRLVTALSRTARPVKVAIMDQALIPGVGNIYASEALYRAHIDPRRPAKRITRPEAKAIAQALLKVMRASLAREMGPEITYVEEDRSSNPFLSGQ